MAHNQKSSNSEGVCKKIYRAVSINPLRASTRPICSASDRKPQTVHQPSLSKTIPIEFDDAPRKNRGVTFFSPNFARREVAILGNNDQKAAKSSSRKELAHQKTERTKTNDTFSDYISKVKDKMIKTESINVGGGRSATRRDSFNDKVSNYINRAKFKIRTTTNVGDDKAVSFK